MTKLCRFIFQLFLLVIIYQFGAVIVKYGHLPVPGNVIGIVLLFCLLWLRVIKLEQIELASSWLLKHLGFFFIPISVGLMTLGHTFITKGISFLLVLSISAFIGLLAAGKATQLVILKSEKGNKQYHDHGV